ncbi:MAG: hypothetical protein QM733_02495 [Ilumatobacteraceae bacterium]
MNDQLDVLLHDAIGEILDLAPPPPAVGAAPARRGFDPLLPSAGLLVPGDAAVPPAGGPASVGTDRVVVGTGAPSADAVPVAGGRPAGDQRGRARRSRPSADAAPVAGGASSMAPG